MTVAELTVARAKYEQDGYFVGPRLVDHALVAEVNERNDAVIAGDYATGIEPWQRTWNPGDDETKLRKIDQPQCCDEGIQAFLRRPEIGAAAAELTGARRIQIWGVQLLFKPPAGVSAGNVGWHQDQQYWLRWWTPDSEIFTCWLALSDVTAEAGPMHFVPGSHRWGLQGDGDFYESDVEAQKSGIVVPEGERWTEVAAVLPPGGASFHHCLTYHASGPNTSSAPRRSFAIHLRTEHSEIADMSGLPLAEQSYLEHLDDPAISPVIFER